MAGLGRLLEVLSLGLRASLRGGGAIALALLAVIPALVTAAVAAAHPTAASEGSFALQLFPSLTLPVLGVLILLVLGSAQFRSEIDRDTLTFLSTRSIRSPEIVVGKYLAAVAGGILFLLPAALLPLGVASAAGAPSPSSAETGAIIGTTVLASVGFGAIFLLIGLLSRSALLLGLLYGFLWEELAPSLPGYFGRLTLLHYLQSYLTDVAGAGPLGGFSAPASTADSVAAIALVAVVGLLLAATLFQAIETAPERTSA